MEMMVFPAFLLVLIFHYAPLPGIVTAFQPFKPRLGILRSPFVGLEQFEEILMVPPAGQVIVNTLIIASLKIIFNPVIPFIFAILLNETGKFVFFDIRFPGGNVNDYQSSAKSSNSL
jgi:putative aldouronate transport system permease protein